MINGVDLPGLDAFELVTLLQEIRDGAGVPLIVLQAEVDGASDSGKQAGVTWMGYSTGPEEIRELVHNRLEEEGIGAGAHTILIVDDDLNIRQPLVKRLELEGYTVLSAQDGEEGLARLDEGPDLVLLDVGLPRLDGFGVLERMRASPEFREIPVIVMTAHARSVEEVSRGLELGANDYVRKPFDMKELTARVRTQLRVREANRLKVEKQRDLAIIELAGAAAHEINNPLSVVMARLELMLARMDGSEESFKDIQQMNELVHRIAGVVHKMGQVRRYQVQNYCGGINILDLDGASQ